MVTATAGPMTYIPSTIDPTIASRVANATFTPKISLQPDDAADSLLMHCCAALTAVGNRALCPKELAELCMQRGWTCSGSQPFAIISSAIRGHLRRRGITTSNASNGLPPGSGRPAPLFTSYELTGPVAAEDVTAIGIVRDEKPAIKRGTLWYLSVHGTGFASPFAPGRDPVAHLKHLTHTIPPPPATSGVAHATPPSPERMPTRRGHKPSFIYQAAIAAEAEEPDSMGRGKRKRRASGIAGGEWESIALPSTSVSSTPTVAALSTSFSSSLSRIAEEPTVSSGPPPGPRPASSNSVVKLKLKLSAPSTTLRPTRSLTHLLEPTLAPSSDDETGDELEEADLARRKRLRFQPGLHSPASTSYRNPRPAFSASTSVIDDDDSSDDGGEDAREAMRAADFDFEFDHAFTSIPLQSGLAELGQLAINTNVSTPATTPRFVEETQESDKIEVDGEEDDDAEVERDEEAGDEASSEVEEEVGVVVLRGKERRRAASAGALDAPAPYNINATLCPARPAAGRERNRSFEGVAVPMRAASEGPSGESNEVEKLASPAPPLPALSVISATQGFAPAGMHPPAHGEPPCQTPFTQRDDLEYDFALTIGGASEPSASVSPLDGASPRSPEYAMAEEGDDFDPASITRRQASESASPFPLGEEDDGVFVSGFGNGMLTSMDLDPPEAVGLDVIDAEFGPVDDACLTSTSLPAFGSAAAFFTSFLGSASVPVEVVGLRRDSDSSYDSEEVAVESEETEEEDAPPARSTRSRAKRPPARSASKRKTRHIPS